MMVWAACCSCFETASYASATSFLANRRRATFSPLGFSLLGSAPQTEQDTSGTKDFTVFRCARVLI